MLTNLEKKIIAAIQADIPVARRPYQRIAQNLNVSEETLLEKLKDLCEKGVIRRFGATIRHQRSGYSANAMVAWKVDEHNISQVGQQFAAFKEVSHCYRRNPTSEWPYNLYTMVHAKDEESCRQTARKMAEKASVKEYNLLFSRRELKKTSMNYFPANNDD